MQKEMISRNGAALLLEIPRAPPQCRPHRKTHQPPRVATDLILATINRVPGQATTHTSEIFAFTEPLLCARPVLRLERVNVAWAFKPHAESRSAWV